MTVKDLAREAQLSVDDAIVRLWDAGLDEVFEPADVIPRKALPTASLALGLPFGTNARSIAAWAVRLAVTESELRSLLISMGIRITPAMRNLPKGSVAKVRRLVNVHATAPAAPAEVIPSPPAPRLVLDWSTIGRVRNPSYISEEEVKQIHWHLVDQFRASGDPIEPPGVRDEVLLSSALARPLTGSGDELKYPTVEMAAAALLHSLTLNHAFHNGNKRTALVSVLVFLDRNGLALTASEGEALRFVLRVARRVLVGPSEGDRADREVLKIAEWIVDHARHYTQGDKPLQFRVLRRILSNYGCQFSHPRAGNRINISRVIEVGGILRQRKELDTQIYYKNEGFDVERSTINKVRRDLHLDEEHGCDSSAFYSPTHVEVIDQVIVRYQTTLKRLARL